MQIKIVFNKSSSKKYPSICSQCKKINFFTQTNNINILDLSIDIFRNNYNAISKIVDVVSKWKSSECYINDQIFPFSILREIYNILLCEERCDKQCRSFCYQGVGWGCKFIQCIELHNDSEWLADPWYAYGYFDEDTWIIEKDRIFEIIQNEVSSKLLTVCKYFSYNRIYDVLDEIPEEIVVTNDIDCKWQFGYREAPLGIDSTKKKCIRPKRIPNSRYFNKELQEFGFIKVSDDLEIELLEAFRNCDYIDKVKMKIIATRISEGKQI